MGKGAWIVLAGWAAGLFGELEAQEEGDVILYDFETDAEVAGWQPVTPGGVPGREPDVTAEASPEHVASGSRSLKLTFAGGMWPAVATARVPISGAWSEFQVLKAVVTV